MTRIILFIALFSGVFIQQGRAQKANTAGLFNKSLSSYYTLKNALATDKTTAAQSAAQELQLAVKAVPQNSLTEGQQQLWAKEAAAIQEQSVLLAGETDLKLQRKSFERISIAFIRLTKGLQLNDKQPISSIVRWENSAGSMKSKLCKTHIMAV